MLYIAMVYLSLAIVRNVCQHVLNATQGLVAHKDGSPALYLLKSEPDEFSIDDLAARPEQTEPWDGVRNFQARNIMQGMKLGDKCLFYHSSTKEVRRAGMLLEAMHT